MEGKVEEEEWKEEEWEEVEEREEEYSAPPTSQGCDFFPPSSSLHFFKFIEYCLDVRMFVQ